MRRTRIGMESGEAGTEGLIEVWQRRIHGGIFAISRRTLQTLIYSLMVHFGLFEPRLILVVESFWFSHYSPPTD